MRTPFASWRRTLLVAFSVATSALLAGLPAVQGAAAEPVLKKGDRVAIIGDSITEQKQYSRFLEDYLTVCTPDLDLWFVQLGWGGETAGGFVNRMNQDLIPFKPNVVTTCYGMNDGGYRAFDEGIGKRYADPMRKIVETLKAAGATVVVGSPGAVDTKTWRGPADVYNDNLAHLRDIARDLAKAEGMPFANLHDALIEVMKKAKAAYGDDYHVCGGDGVHPSANGQLVMAYAFLKALGASGDLGTITVDGAKASATGGHKVLAAADGTVDLESTQYPFCFFGDPKSPDSTRSILPYLPFNQDLNRLTLVVKGLKGDRAKVTWGKESKTFSKDDLAKGVNLAAEFLDNPFSDPFRKVDEAVARKQNFETFLIKEFNRVVGGIANQVKDDAECQAAIATLRTRLLAKHDALAKAVREAAVPVKHTIMIAAE
jgi:lysophospholipase L1-like esterase